MSKDTALAIRKSTTMNPEIKDTIDRQIFHLVTHERVAQLKFREDGMLMPFGASRRGFDVPNPVLFQFQDSWPMHEAAAPLSGWSTLR